MMAFFRSVYLLFQKVFGFLVSKGSEFSTSDPLTMPAFVPAMPKPVRLDVHFKPQRPKDALAGLECTQVGGVVVISCGDRRHSRRVTRAVDKVCNAWRKGLDHRRHVRERDVIVLARDMKAIHKAMGGASYHELRALSAA